MHRFKSIINSVDPKIDSMPKCFHYIVKLLIKLKKKSFKLKFLKSFNYKSNIAYKFNTYLFKFKYGIISYKTLKNKMCTSINKTKKLKL